MRTLSKNDRQAVGVYRLPMRSRRADVVFDETFDRARQLSVCGIGGILDDPPDNLDEAIHAMSRKYDERTARRLERFAHVPDGSFVWTQADEWFFLARIDGPWRYDDSPSAAAVDLVHVRACRWVQDPIPHSSVPPSVSATFARGGLNFQEIHNNDVGSRTRSIAIEFAPELLTNRRSTEMSTQPSDDDADAAQQPPPGPTDQGRNGGMASRENAPEITEPEPEDDD